jgi:pimeloyl-ACP methyl ester carboxylesterase
MKQVILISVLLLSFSCTTKTKEATLIISQPLYVADDDWEFQGTENMIFVPENRNDPLSRKIPLHFIKLPAKKTSTLPPVVFLGAGPGEPYSTTVFYKGRRAEAWRYELDFVNQNRDVILINQRGNSDSPGMQIPEFRYKWNNGGSLDKPFDLNLRGQKRKAAYAMHIKKYTDQGIDLRGYDILHFVDDIEAVRQQLNYDKIALVGVSFASQWALGYIQRYPEHVDRALLSGVEPLDYNYDDAQERWKVLEKINAYAMADVKIAKDLPKIGLIEAFKTVITRLEEQPQTVVLKGTNDGEDETIVVGADDLRFSYLNPEAGSFADDAQSWPKYITEMYNGDFRFLALISVGRVYNSSAIMTNPLFNNSLGVSASRELEINSRPANKWLGDVNNHYTWTRDICPSPKVSDDFRIPKKHNIPIVLIQGDMDTNTPYGNSQFLIKHLEKGHLITIKRGFHNAKRALIFDNRELTNSVYEFMNVDFNENPFNDFKKNLPEEYALPLFKFWPIKGESLFEKYRNENN